MVWLEHWIDVLIIVLLAATLLLVVQVKNLLIRLVAALRGDLESIKRELQTEMQEVRVDNREARIEGSREFASTRKSMLDDLDAIYHAIKDISAFKSTKSGGTGPK